MGRVYLWSLPCLYKALLAPFHRWESWGLWQASGQLKLLSGGGFLGCCLLERFQLRDTVGKSMKGLCGEMEVYLDMELMHPIKEMAWGCHEASFYIWSGNLPPRVLCIWGGYFSFHHGLVLLGQFCLVGNFSSIGYMHFLQTDGQLSWLQMKAPSWRIGLLDAAQVQSLDFFSHSSCSYLSKPPTLTEFKHKSGKPGTVSSLSNVHLPAKT